ncbi:endonuclease/exonuclease/phosphatase family protein [Roseovarius sp. SCSIO 43702]|nr:endonuclease/exonuclease/phosphatase family protein [Roseovarius sp. SCSIO 43702]
MRIASYNIRKAVGLDWRRDPGRILDVLAEIDADVVALQEADKRLAPRPGVLPIDRLRDELGYDFADLAPNDQSHGWHGNALLYRKGLLRPAHTRRLILPAFEPRGAVAVGFDAPRFDLLGVHLGLTAGTRARQLKALRADMADQDHPVIVAGDFNMWRGADSFEAVFGPDLTLLEPGPSFHAARPTACLDRFILSHPDLPHSVHVHHSPRAARASDHLPIVLDIDLPR